MAAFQRVPVRELIAAGEAELKTGPFGTQLKASEYTEEGRPHRGGAHGRTFRDQGIIGLAFRQQKVCRTRQIASASFQTDLQSDMQALNLGEDSQQMSAEVRSLLAVPVLASGNTIMVLYADSYHQGLFSDAVVRQVVEMTNDFCAYLQSIDLANARNFPQERKLDPTPLAESALSRCSSVGVAESFSAGAIHCIESRCQTGEIQHLLRTYRRFRLQLNPVSTRTTTWFY